MKETSSNRKPEIRGFNPVWFHHHGSKMYLAKLDLEHHIITISASAANLTIQRASNINRHVEGYVADWEIYQCKPLKEGVQGRVHLCSDEKLAAVFGLSTLSGDDGDWLLGRYGGDSAAQREYIRWENFLNIPCPGTGHDGDPNISIMLNEEIVGAVAQLLAANK